MDNENSYNLELTSLEIQPVNKIRKSNARPGRHKKYFYTLNEALKLSDFDVFISMMKFLV